MILKCKFFPIIPEFGSTYFRPSPNRKDFMMGIKMALQASPIKSCYAPKSPLFSLNL
jgi:hypothetical protein